MGVPFRADSIAQQVILTNQLQLTLRPASPNDAERVLAYLEQVAGESEYLTFGPGDFDIDLEQERAFIQQAQELPTSLFLLAEKAGEIVGTLTFCTEKQPRAQHAGEFGMSIVRKYWNLGIGSRMLAYLLEWARQTHVIRKINLMGYIDQFNINAEEIFCAPQPFNSSEYFVKILLASIYKRNITAGCDYPQKPVYFANFCLRLGLRLI